MICYWDKVQSPIGLVYLAATDEGLVYCANAKQSFSEMSDWISKYLPDHTMKEGSNEILDLAKAQLKAYFLGDSEILNVPLNLVGTSYRKKVWQALQTIPYGETRSYGQIASQIGNPKGPRSVGQANHNNPIAYFVP